MAETKSIKVDFGDGERTVYFGKRNLDQMDKVLKAESDGQVAVLVITIISRCLNAEGSLMFSDADKKRIRNDFDPVAVLRVAREIREYDEEVEQPGN